MNSVHEVRWQVADEHLRRLRADPVNDSVVRLAALSIELLARHRVDRRGRCVVCRGRLFRRRRCSVSPAISFYLEQPLGLLAQIGSDEDDRAIRDGAFRA